MRLWTIGKMVILMTMSKMTIRRMRVSMRMGMRILARIRISKMWMGMRMRRMGG